MTICKQCGHQWTPRKRHFSAPRICPKCKRFDWNHAKVEK